MTSRWTTYNIAHIGSLHMKPVTRNWDNQADSLSLRLCQYQADDEKNKSQHTFSSLTFPSLLICVYRASQRKRSDVQYSNDIDIMSIMELSNNESLQRSSVKSVQPCFQKLFHLRYFPNPLTVKEMRLAWCVCKAMLDIKTNVDQLFWIELTSPLRP